MPGFERYALYFAPARGTPLEELGTGWMGFDAESGAERDRLRLFGLDRAQIARLSEVPSRYGFHGTLKPPFRLAPGKTPDMLVEAAQQLAARFRRFDIRRLEVKRLGRFLALTPVLPQKQINHLADLCVTELDGFRAPLTEAETARRERQPLTPEQKALLDEWGYPYVLDQFRFHLTLTGPMNRPEAERLQGILSKQLAPYLEAPVPVREICLFGDPGAGQRFRLLERIALAEGRLSAERIQEEGEPLCQ